MYCLPRSSPQLLSQPADQQGSPFLVSASSFFPDRLTLKGTPRCRGSVSAPVSAAGGALKGSEASEVSRLPCPTPAVDLRHGIYAVSQLLCLQKPAVYDEKQGPEGEPPAAPVSPSVGHCTLTCSGHLSTSPAHPEPWLPSEHGGGGVRSRRVSRGSVPTPPAVS